MYKIFSSVIAVFFGAVLWSSAHAQINNIAEAVNQAGLQRMLSQRIFKNYALVTLKIKTSDHQKDLTDTIKRYDSILSDLKEYPVTAEFSETIDKVDRHWTITKEIASALLENGKVTELHTATEALLEANEELTRNLTKAGGVETAAIINISGRQRMLSQRIAGLYMLKTMGLNEETFAEKIQNATFEFKRVQGKLQDSGLNNERIQSNLKKVGKQFKRLEFSVNKKGDTYFPFVVSQAAEKVLKLMIVVTSEYVSLANNH